MTESIYLLKAELSVTVILFLLLFIKLGKLVKNDSLLVLVQFLLLVNFIMGFAFNKTGTAFGGMFYSSAGIAFQKSVLNLAVYLVSLLFAGWLKKQEHLPELLMLMLSALLGMFFMISSGNMLLFYLSLELATIPLAAMVNFDLDRKISSEAAMKMILSSAFSSGILLFGISLLYGITGTIDFGQVPNMLNGSALQIMVLVFLLAGFAFKLSVVPFHLWTADVYEGAPMMVTSFLSVVSKGAMAFVFITVLYKVFQPMQQSWHDMLAVLAIVTILTGNLFALRQKNIKRFLAFSSISQVGFVLVGISSNAPAGTTSVVYFIVVYVFSNLAAFAVASAISLQTGKEMMDDYKGLYRTNPFLGWIMALALFSLAGIPPTAGFFGKLFLITAGASKANYGFVIFISINLVVSLYYYLMVVRAIFMDKNNSPVEKIALHPATRLGLVICGTAIIFIGLMSWIYEYISSLN